MKVSSSNNPSVSNNIFKLSFFSLSGNPIGSSPPGGGGGAPEEPNYPEGGEPQEAKEEDFWEAFRKHLVEEGSSKKKNLKGLIYNLKGVSVGGLPEGERKAHALGVRTERRLKAQAIFKERSEALKASQRAQAESESDEEAPPQAVGGGGSAPAPARLSEGGGGSPLPESESDEEAKSDEEAETPPQAVGGGGSAPAPAPARAPQTPVPVLPRPRGAPPKTMSDEDYDALKAKWNSEMLPKEGEAVPYFQRMNELLTRMAMAQSATFRNEEARPYDIHEELGATTGKPDHLSPAEMAERGIRNTRFPTPTDPGYITTTKGILDMIGARTREGKDKGTGPKGGALEAPAWTGVAKVTHPGVQEITTNRPFHFERGIAGQPVWAQMKPYDADTNKGGLLPGRLWVGPPDAQGRQPIYAPYKADPETGVREAFPVVGYRTPREINGKTSLLTTWNPQFMPQSHTTSGGEGFSEEIKKAYGEERLAKPQNITRLGIVFPKEPATWQTPQGRLAVGGSTSSVSTFDSTSNPGWKGDGTGGPGYVGGQFWSSEAEFRAHMARQKKKDKASQEAWEKEQRALKKAQRFGGGGGGGGGGDQSWRYGGGGQ